MEAADVAAEIAEELADEIADEIAEEVADELADEIMDRLDDDVSQMAYGLYGDADDGDFDDDGDDLSDSLSPIDDLGMIYGQLADDDNYGDDGYDDDDSGNFIVQINLCTLIIYIDDFFPDQRGDLLPSNFLSFNGGLDNPVPFDVEDDYEADEDRDRVLDLSRTDTKTSKV